MPAKFLRPVLMIDAATCLATGALLMAAAGVLAPLTNLSKALLFEAGLVLLPFAAFAWWAGRQTDRRPGPARAVMLANIAWVVLSGAVIAGPWTNPNMLGTALVAVQAAAVAALAVLQAIGLTQSARTAHA